MNEYFNGDNLTVRRLEDIRPLWNFDDRGKTLTILVVEVNDMGIEQLSGTVFDIQRYSVHDGPGIRTLVFMKGCPLRCLWCSNPEGLRSSLDILSDPKKCIGCGHCKRVCPKEAIRLDAQNGFEINRMSCDCCGRCADVCPTGAKSIKGKEMTVGEVVRVVEREAAFYQGSGGGITMGGGEILMQPKFVCEVLKTCKERGINTAIETSAYGRWEWLSKIIEVTDTIYTDLKSMDPNNHKRLTAVDNGLIIENIRRINASMARVGFTEKKWIIRMPLIPGFNDSLDEAEAASEFIKGFENVDHVELLPFHNFGENKYKMLDLAYAFFDRPNASKEELETFREILLDSGHEISIKEI